MEQSITKFKLRKDLIYKHNVLSNKKEFPLNKAKVKPRNDQKLLTIRNKLMILDDFDANVEKIESFLKHGGTPKQILSEQDLVKVINHVLVRAPAVLKSAKFDEFKDIVTSKMDSFKDEQLYQLYLMGLVFSHRQ